MKTKESMPPYDSVIGKRFTYLTITSEIESVKKGKEKPARKMVWCQCDCGSVKQIRMTALTSRTTKACGYCDLATHGTSGESHHLWKGGVRFNQFGYVLLAKSIAKKRYPNSILSNKSSDTFEHVAVMSHHLKREIRRGETIHHLDGDRQNNDISNLELWSSSHPAGQRIKDKIDWAKKFLAIYDPSSLR